MPEQMDNGTPANGIGKIRAMERDDQASSMTFQPIAPARA
jgi:hypothetical protein